MTVAIWLAFALANIARLAGSAGRVAAIAQRPSGAAQQFDALYTGVRDRTIAREDAQSKVAELLPLIADEFYARGGTDTPKTGWRFPLAGYGAESIGGRNGSGYVAAGYDWFEGFKSRGHPGHDLFIHDRDEDELDDRTGKPVAALSISSGIVVAYAPEWTSASGLRGGRYVWIYDPSQRGLFYYAHLRRVLVAPGDLVAPGQPIGEVGRSGRNAAPRRSPTHLHVMFLAVDTAGRPAPRNIYADLLRLGRRTSAR